MVDTCAHLMVFGVNPLPFLHSKEELDTLLMSQMIDKALELDEIRLKNLAIEIANQVSKLL